MVNPGPIAALESTDELRDRLAHSAYVRYQVPPGVNAPQGGHMWATSNAAASTFTGERLLVLGDPQGAVDLLLGLLDAWPTTLGDGPEEVTLPRDAHLLLPAPLRPDTARHWAYRWLSVAPALMADEDQVLELRFTDSRLPGFLTEHHPTYEIAPGTPSIVRWAGIEDDDGNLIACGSHQRTEFTGFPHLGSIATATPRRGTGLGAAVTAWLSRRAIDEAGVCTLIHPSGNTSAARLFTRLGYRTDDSYTTFRLHR